jgi:hypothetical protein
MKGFCPDGLMVVGVASRDARRAKTSLSSQMCSHIYFVSRVMSISKARMYDNRGLPNVTQTCLYNARQGSHREN